jgi:quinol monooxygenase YgiN
MIGLELAVTSDDSHRVELLQTLENLSHDQAGTGDCLECRVYERMPRSNDFMWHQWWRSERQLEGHLASVAFRTLLGAIKVLGTLESARVVELQDSTSVLGAFLKDRVALGNPQPEI